MAGGGSVDPELKIIARLGKLPGDCNVWMEGEDCAGDIPDFGIPGPNGGEIGACGGIPGFGGVCGGIIGIGEFDIGGNPPGG